MPNYDYRCQKCGKFTVQQSIKDKALDTCTTCGSPVHRVIGKNVGVLYKCSGFYCTDSKGTSCGEAASS
ncbi:MAG: FmdB family transcriptional regulator [Firmicutes bacterium HGW-Firmicutes-12]|nr:MAG: FmdB family transcriptional regulator [Firmicutes bacterium HGW-Firmicutes-12]